MFFTASSPNAFPNAFRQSLYSPAGRSLERFLSQSLGATRAAQCASYDTSYGDKVTQDDTSYTLSFDLPGVAKDQLSIDIEGNLVRVKTKDGAPRQYSRAYELPTDIDASSSEAKLELGVLTLKLGKLVPVSRATELAIQ